ncbi:SpoIIE family protein phosphatase [Aquihabitans sp. G128]|uniref:PP2C family protein-serine/threonine phosphatase n=1 Tax=Aquihabitans sp. G128 TaxID=2849779 RepID=UPI0020B3D2FE
MRATVIAPVRSAGTTLGVLALSTVERPLQPDDLAMVSEVAHRLALALGNVEAYLDERRRGEVLQLSLLPTIPAVDGLEVAVRYLAATDGSKVGGDWYDVIPIGDGQVDLVIGDVVGHDMQAAVEMSQARNALRAFACADGATPAATLTGLDHMSNRLGMELATAVVARVDLEADTLTWSNAGHTPPLLVTDGHVTVLDDYLGAMLGIGTPSDRRQRTVPFPPGSTLVFYTDGAIEDPELSLDEGLARLTEAVRTSAEDGTEAICDAVVASTLDDGLDRRDDIAILVVSRVAER